MYRHRNNSNYYNNNVDKYNNIKNSFRTKKSISEIIKESKLNYDISMKEIHKEQDKKRKDNNIFSTIKIKTKRYRARKKYFKSLEKESKVYLF